MSTTTAKILVSIYKVWHGRLRLKGAGWVLRRAAWWSKGLRRFQQPIPNIGYAALDFRDVGAYAWLHYLGGESSQEDGLFAALERFVSADSVYWDVGANVGITTAHVLTRCKPRSVYAIEPNPDAVEMLRSLFSDCANVFVINAALSDSDKKMMNLFVPTGDCSRASVEKHLMNWSTFRSCEITCYRGDTLIQEKRAAAPNVIKIDVEGHEKSVLQGLQQSIARYRPVIVFEHLFLSDFTVNQLIPNGYSLYTVHSRTGEIVAGLSRSVGHNCLLMPAAM